MPSFDGPFIISDIRFVIDWWDEKEKSPLAILLVSFCKHLNVFCRGDWIRTSDLFVPNEARYRPDASEYARCPITKLIFAITLPTKFSIRMVLFPGIKISEVF